MAKRTRNLAVAAMAAAVLGTPGLSAAADTFPGNQPVPGRHVRSSNSDLIALIDQAAERSATFRSLVDVINRSDSIVTAADSHRYMRVVVDTRKADWDLMGSIGHELRHTIEIIDQPSIRSNAGKYFFYAQNGTHGTATARETQAAVDAGNSVRDEVHQFTRHQSE
jgi:hypothetical protein